MPGAVTPGLRRWLLGMLGLFALLTANAVYLLAVRLAGVTAGQSQEDLLYIWMLLAHLVLGGLFLVPFIAFGLPHVALGRRHANRDAARRGWFLLGGALILLGSGLVLTRLEGIIDITDPRVRRAAYWLHLLAPVAAIWLYWWHRAPGTAIRWRAGRRSLWAAAAVTLAVAGIWRLANHPGPAAHTAADTTRYFPSLGKSTTGIIPAQVLMADDYCQQCHGDVYAQWSHSVHRFSSFNNPAYRFSVLETRRVTTARDGNVSASRWCAGCHDPVPLYTGRFDDPTFDESTDPTAKAGITCTSCHAIQSVDSPRGNADFTLAEPVHYPFAFSDSAALRWLNRQLVRAKPDFHKRTFLKPFFRSAELCSGCHKVHLPPELNRYKWVRGQNHYDSYLLSGVSGHGAQSFYYPDKAVPTCAGCHMPLQPSRDFGAQDFDGSGQVAVHDHQFPGANTAIPHLLGFPPEIQAKLAKFNTGIARLDLFALHDGPGLDGELHAPLRPQVPTLEPGRTYVLDAVVRTLKIGHEFTQGTVDSNEVWVDVEVRDGARVIGRSGGLGPGGAVDPWSHFANVYMLDRDGNRIDRRNPQDIFVPLYNHQIPPGAADVLHYRLAVPTDVTGPLTVVARLRYRKFDTTYLRYVYGPERDNDLPILELASDQLVLPVAGGGAGAASAESAIPEWQRWNDYGIGLLRKVGAKSRGELGAAETAFRRVEALGRPDGPLNLARVYLAQGAVGEQAVAALARAAEMNPPPAPWVLAWLRSQVNKQNGFLAEAASDLRSVLATRVPDRGFDFSGDYRIAVELGETLLEQAHGLRGDGQEAARQALLAEARRALESALGAEPENLSAHYLLAGLCRDTGDDACATDHLTAVERYRVDDNARDRAVLVARGRDAAADHAAEAIVIYDLQRIGAYGLTRSPDAALAGAAAGGMP